MYSEYYKACDTIFDEVPYIDIANGVHLRSIFLKEIELESKTYFTNSSDSITKKYIPGAYCSNEAEAKKKILDFRGRFLHKYCVPFAVAAGDKSVPIGYIICFSPLTTDRDSGEKIDDWTIDIWLGEGVRGKGIMEHVLYSVLEYLQSKEVDRVYMYVDKDNYICIHIIEKLGFIPFRDSGDQKFYKYGVEFKPNVSL
jgi:RimJ/RimL family protein N-acetyltransferase